ncbi:hypothetical protein C7271_09720 [filamentous cyanobacterium CCP5]|nr:hypothetical protein C7271_09720 [filamentous cyanobacterium CCP5]
MVLSGVFAALAGLGLGVAAAEMSRNQFESRLYQNLHGKLAIAGIVLGAATGASLESIRQLKQQRDREWQDRI